MQVIQLDTGLVTLAAHLAAGGLGTPNAINPLLVKSMSLKLVTTADVGNRDLRVTLRDAVPADVMQFAVSNVQAASLTGYFAFMGAADGSATARGLTGRAEMPEIILLPGWTLLVTDSAGIEATDQVRLTLAASVLKAP